MTNTLSAIVRYLLYALLIFTPLAHGSVQGWSITTIHLITTIALTALLIQKTWTWDWKWINTPLDKPFLCLAVLCILSSVFSLHHRTSLWAVILLLNYVTIFYLIIHTVNTRSRLRNLIYVIIGVATLLSIFGLMKKLGSNPFPWYDYSHLKRGTDIVSSTYVNPNHFAGYLEMAIPLILGLLLIGLRGGKLILLCYLSLILLTGLIISLSRGGWVSATIGLAFMAAALLISPYFERKKLFATIVAGSLFLALIVVANRPVVHEIRTLTEKAEEPSFASRVLVWGKVLNMTSDHPLLGTGPGTFSTIFTQYQPAGFTKRFFRAHNDYLQFISEMGMFLVPIVGWMMIAFYGKGLKKLKNPSRLVRGTTLGAMSGVTAILIHSIFDFNLHIPANALVFTVLAAIVVSPIPKYDQHHWVQQRPLIDPYKRPS
jgi:O-antigen ligase